MGFVGIQAENMQIYSKTHGKMGLGIWTINHGETCWFSSHQRLGFSQRISCEIMLVSWDVRWHHDDVYISNNICFCLKLSPPNSQQMPAGNELLNHVKLLNHQVGGGTLDKPTCPKQRAASIVMRSPCCKSTETRSRCCCGLPVAPTTKKLADIWGGKNWEPKKHMCIRVYIYILVANDDLWWLNGDLKRGLVGHSVDFMGIYFGFHAICPRIRSRKSDPKDLGCLGW